MIIDFWDNAGQLDNSLTTQSTARKLTHKPTDCGCIVLRKHRPAEQRSSINYNVTSTITKENNKNIKLITRGG